MIQENNIPHVPVDRCWMESYISRNTAIIVSRGLVTPVIELLNNRYFFNTPSVFVEKHHDEYKFVYDIPIDEEKLIFIISPHDKIIVMKVDEYETFYRRKQPICIDSTTSLPSVYKTVDPIALERPVIMQPDSQKNISEIRIFHNRIMFVIHSHEYEIPRSIFDMLYVESEDFCPTVEKDSDVIIHSQVRHSFVWQGDYVNDLLKSDIGLICDTQDLLKKEYQIITSLYENTPSMIKKIFGIHGIAGSGKDTLVTLMKMHIALSRFTHLDGSIIQNWLNTAVANINTTDWLTNVIDVEIERFARPLKTCIAGFFGVDVDKLNDQAFKKQTLNPEVWYADDVKSLTIRDLHTRIADAIKEAINPSIFANTCMERALNSTSEMVIINDLRLPEELEILSQNNVYLIKIQRSEAERERKKYIEEHHQIHNSEQGLPSESFDFVIRNDSSYMDLAIKVADMLLDAGVLTNDYVKQYKKNTESIK